MPIVLLCPQKTGYCPPPCPKFARVMLPRVPLTLPKLVTQVDQLHWNIWLIRHELSHIEDPLRMPSLDHRLLVFHFLLYSMALCQAGTSDLTMCIIIVTYCLSARDAGFFRTTGFIFIWVFLFASQNLAKDLSTLSSQRTKS